MPYHLLSESATATLPGGIAGLVGWEVLDDTGALVGAVRDALLDEAGELRYLDVQLAGVIGARRVLLPIGFARLQATVRVVEIPGLTTADVRALLRALPDYVGDAASVTDAYERRLGPAWSRALTDPEGLGATRSSDPDVPRPAPGADGAGRARREGGARP